MVILGKSRLVYVPIPKNATSSVMKWLYRLEHDADATGFDLHHVWHCVANGGRWHAPMPDYFSFAVLRDPVERFVSGYNNRVVHRGALTRKVPRLARLGLSREPDINEFARKLPRYQAHYPDIAYHFTPQWNYLRRIANRLTRFYSPMTLAWLHEDVAEHLGADPGPIGHYETGGHNPELRAELDERSLTALRRWYKVDFKFVPRVLEQMSAERH